MNKGLGISFVPPVLPLNLPSHATEIKHRSKQILACHGCTTQRQCTWVLVPIQIHLILCGKQWHGVL